MVINILPGKENLGPISLGDTIPTYSKIGADDILSTLNVTNENAALLTSDLLKITNKILEGEGALGALITDSTLTQDIRTTLLNLKQTTHGTNRLIGSLNQRLSTIDMDNSAVGVLLKDTLLGNQIRRVGTNLEKSSSSIAETSQQLNIIIMDIKTSESAFNYLTKDPELLKSLEATMLEIREASQKLNENMTALQNNFLFRNYFKKQERDADKKGDEKQRLR
jgi:phospholipid/cholesterol/gamma-HCH transport system substrate-binding protein